MKGISRLTYFVLKRNQKHPHTHNNRIKKVIFGTNPSWTFGQIQFLNDEVLHFELLSP